MRQWIGVELDETSWRERAVSSVGGFVAILAVIGISGHALGLDGAAMLIGSMGASSVLLFGVPHGALSQPWPVLAGHLVSALIGVGCARWIDNRELAAACAVGLAIGAMHQCKCIHPPGGATALTAVMGGPAVRSLGWSFMWHPVLLNALVLVGVAVIFNSVFPWRRYPTHLHRRKAATETPLTPAHADVVAALRRLDSFIDITEEDLVRLVQLLAPRSPNL